MTTPTFIDTVEARCMGRVFGSFDLKEENSERQPVKGTNGGLATLECELKLIRARLLLWPPHVLISRFADNINATKRGFLFLNDDPNLAFSSNVSLARPVQYESYSLPL
jgi:hypothetical protein